MPVSVAEDFTEMVMNTLLNRAMRAMKSMKSMKSMDIFFASNKITKKKNWTKIQNPLETQIAVLDSPSAWAQSCSSFQTRARLSGL